MAHAVAASVPRMAAAAATRRAATQGSAQEKTMRGAQSHWAGHTAALMARSTRVATSRGMLRVQAAKGKGGGGGGGNVVRRYGPNEVDEEISDADRAQMDAEAERMAQAFLAELGEDDDDDERYLDEFEEEEDGDDDGWGTGEADDDDGDYSNPFASAAAELDDEELSESLGGGAAAAESDGVFTNKGPAKSRRDRTQIPVALLPRIAVIGRPNVGKSALFNRLSGTAAAIVYDTPGVTRDRLYVRGFWGTDEFLLIDTGGLISPSRLAGAGLTPELPDHDEDPGTEASALRIPGMIEAQAAAAVEEADAVIVVMDGQSGPCASDDDIMQWMRRRYPDKPLVLAVNKCESPTLGPIQVASFWEYGHEPIGISALSGTGTGELLDALMAVCPKTASILDESITQVAVDKDEPIRVAICGRPNVGKSSLVNAIVGEERSIVSKMSGTTRDAIDTDFMGDDGQRFVLVDTAGIRKRAQVASKKDIPEKLSVKTAIKAMTRSDVTVLVLDAMQGPTEQDFRLAERVQLSGRACVLCMNKWDLVPKDTDTMMQYEKNLRGKLRNIDWANIVFTSATATAGGRVQTVLSAVKEAASEHRRRVTTATINQVVTDALIVRAPPVTGGRKGRIYYATQAAVRPPTFVMFVNDTKMFSEQYRRFMEKQLRTQIGFDGSPLRILWRGKVNKRAASTWVKGNNGTTNSKNPSSSRNAE